MDARLIKPAAVVRLASREWQVIGLIVLATTVCVIGLFWPTVESLVAAWSSSRTFAHGFLMLPVTGYLVWCCRQAWLPLTPEPSAWGVVALSAIGAAWLVGHRLNLIWLEQLAVIASLPGLVWTLLGTTIARAISWPLGLLIFMLPVGTSIEPWLQDFTTLFILGGLRLVDVPYLIQEYRITIASGTWEVAPDCGGLRYLLPGLALSYAFATLVYQQPVRRFTFLGISAVILMIANGIRAYGIIMGDYMGVAEGADHRIFSYTIYGLTMPLLFWCALRWEETKNVVFLGSSANSDRGSHVMKQAAVMALVSLSVLAIAPLSVQLWGFTP
ncbi:membrane protein of unknown function [Nitrospira japonica]|uniref:Exosortase n=1 Tax=Nitrospira japonica TaxID=1325564 RepID=A0A1W1IB09_9BACT|nr:membrane protein of unknown function [Nitrospira japonica]